MKLQQLVEMGAAKTCEKCGKTMSAHHYWYKGGWRCKAARDEEKSVDPATSQPQQAAPAQTVPVTQQTPAPVQKQTDLGTQKIDIPDEQPKAQVEVVTKPLSIEVEIIAEALPELEDELKKINKTAAKVGSPPITTDIIKTEFRDVSRVVDDPDGVGGLDRITVKQKYLTIKLTGTTPRIQSTDGTMWNFVGVITPSSQGKALLKLAPSTEDTDGIRQMYSANPYYCDYCKKIRQRNETFIVQNGNQYRQVGRNCLRDFVGGADPQALLNYFSWFQTPEALQARLSSTFGDGEEHDGVGGGRRGQQYLSIESVLAATLATIQVRGGYVSSKAENGKSTASEVRFIFWGRFSHDTSESERAAVAEIRRLRDSDEIKAKAAAIVDWFNTIPETEVNANTFYQNVKVMIDEGVVSERMLGYIVGLYPAYQRAQQQSSETKGGVRLIKEWPAAWGEGPREITNEHATVKFVKNIQGAYGSSQLIMMMLDNGLGVTWRYSGQNRVMIDDEFHITGELQKDTYREPATVKFVPSRKWLRSAFKE